MRSIDEIISENYDVTKKQNAYVNEIVNKTQKITRYDAISTIIEGLKPILAKDRAQKQPLFLQVKDSFLHTIVRQAVCKEKQTFLVGIAGESASGKTTFVQNAIKACTDEEDLYTVINGDDYYKDQSHELEQAGSYEAFFAQDFSFDTPEAMDLNLMAEHLLQLKNGQEVKSPLYDFVTCKSILNQIPKAPAKIVLSEGLYNLNEEVRDIMDVKVYIYTPFEILKKRWFERAKTRGKVGLAAQMQFQDVNMTAQKYIKPTMLTADVVLNGLTNAGYIEEISNEILSTVKAAFG